MRILFITIFIFTGSVFSIFKEGDIVYNLNWIDSNGENHSLEELTSQGKTVVLFWGSLACSSCQATAGPFQKLWTKYEDSGLVYMLSVEEWEDHTHPYARNLSGDMLFDGLNPLTVVIGKNRSLIFWNHVVGPSYDGSWLDEGIQKGIKTFQGLHHLKNKSRILFEAGTSEIVDLKDYFNHSEDQEIEFSMNNLDDSTNFEISLNDDFLNITNSTQNSVYLDLSAESEDQVLTKRLLLISKNKIREKIFCQNDSISSQEKVHTQIYENSLSDLNSIAADDFMIDENGAKVSEVVIMGNSSIRGIFDSFNVQFYADSNSFPGKLIADYQILDAFAAGNEFYIELPDPLFFPVGKYWISVQCNNNYTEAGDFFWFSNNGSSNLNGFYWKNYGSENLFDIDWISASELSFKNHDLAFALYGEEVTGIGNNKIIEKDFDLNAYPNPFNPETKISFKLKEEQAILLEIFNAKGQLVESFNNQKLAPGTYSYSFKANTQGSGIYYCRLSTSTRVVSKKMILLR